jgi:hypothetical protein
VGPSTHDDQERKGPATFSRTLAVVAALASLVVSVAALLVGLNVEQGDGSVVAGAAGALALALAGGAVLAAFGATLSALRSPYPSRSLALVLAALALDAAWLLLISAVAESA